MSWTTQYLTNRQVSYCKGLYNDANHIANATLEERKEIYPTYFHTEIKNNFLRKFETIKTWKRNIFSKTKTPITIVVHTNEQNKVYWEPLYEYQINCVAFGIGNITDYTISYMDGIVEENNKKKNNDYRVDFKYNY